MGAPVHLGGPRHLGLHGLQLLWLETTAAQMRNWLHHRFWFEWHLPRARSVIRPVSPAAMFRRMSAHIIEPRRVHVRRWCMLQLGFVMLWLLDRCHLGLRQETG